MAGNVIKNGKFLSREDDNLYDEYLIRKSEKIIKKIPKGSPIDEGWSINNDNYKTFTKIEKPKRKCDLWEDRIWSLFYEMGMAEISTRKFELWIKQKELHGVIKSKEIDVIAADDEVVFFVECKTQDILGKCQQLEGYVAIFRKNCDLIEKALRKHFGKRRFVPIFATWDIIWSESEKDDLESEGIIVLDDYDVDQLLELSKLTGEGAKYQVYNRLFINKEIKNLSIKLPAIESMMGGKKYYTFNLEPAHLLKIAYVHQRSKCSFIDMADSYQRIINPKRQKAIKRFLDDGGYFPGNLIVNFTKQLKKVEPIGTKNQLESSCTKSRPVMITLPSQYGCAWIIDGQHRLYSFSDSLKKKTETIPVVAFVGEKVSVQAKMFIDINENQKSIFPDLRWDLYEDLYRESDSKTEILLYSISRLVKMLNVEKTSPFMGNITIPKAGNKGHLSFTSFCVHVKRNGFFNDDTDYFNKDQDEMIIYIYTMISTYFNIIKEAFGEIWFDKDKHFINHNSGIIVMLSILKDIVDILTKKEREDKVLFKSRIDSFLEPLILHILDQDDDTIKKYRNASSSLQASRELQAEMTRIILDSKPYYSRFMEKYAKVQEKKAEISRIPIEKLLKSEESDSLEFKGSLLMDIDRLLKGDGKRSYKSEIAISGVLKSITAFLNSKNGGDVIIGVIEQNKYKDYKKANILEEYLLEYSDKYIIGIDDNKFTDWDNYQLKIIELIKNHIAEELIELVKIEKRSFKGKNLYHIHIESDCPNNWYYLDNEFIARNGNSNIKLHGSKMDRYKEKIKKILVPTPA